MSQFDDDGERTQDEEITHFFERRLAQRALAKAKYLKEMEAQWHRPWNRFMRSVKRKLGMKVVTKKEYDKHVLYMWNGGPSDHQASKDCHP